MAYTYKLRRDLSSRWAIVNPVLAQGEPGYEFDTGKLKIGDGVNVWTALPYLVETAALQAHMVNTENPHGVTKTQLGLSEVTNTSDVAKPISDAHQAALDMKASVASLTQEIFDRITAVQAEADARIAELSAKADLVGGVIPTSQVPAIATGETVTVANQAEMLSLTAEQVQPGDVAIRSDQDGRRWLLAATNPSVLGSWIALEVPDAVSSVQGQQGAVILGKADIGLPNVDNTADVVKPVSMAAQVADSLRVLKVGDAMTGDLTIENTALATVNSDTSSNTLKLKGRAWESGVSKELSGKLYVAASTDAIKSPALIWKPRRTDLGTESVALKYEAFANTSISGLLSMFSLSNEGWGGKISVDYSGCFTLYKADGVTKGILGAAGFGQGSLIGYNSFWQNSYVAEVRTFFNSKILLTAGRPPWYYGNDAGKLGNEYVQSDLGVIIYNNKIDRPALRVQNIASQTSPSQEWLSSSGIVQARVTLDGGIDVLAAGKGLKLKSPDGLITKTVTLNNAGDLVVA